ncbi:MAG TPA: nucleotidyltransferase domain-containing protein [Candidatus Nanoarchaeia archaeon]|nr:nucleotidyltransferase domain-containing protein [Candidatus Nanoarchaeia archaeon]
MNHIPTKEEEGEISSAVKSVLSRIKVKDAMPILGGSGAKNTWLPGTHDIDIYVKFNYKKFKDKSELISEFLYKAIKSKFKLTRLHGSRDYFQTKAGKFTVEIVPILDIKKADEAKNITDISQLHVDYVRKYKKLSNEIRLAKLFCKVCEVYGAESFIQGFSGYVIELLVIHYGSFKNLIKNVVKWKAKTIIGSSKDADNLNYSKTISPLILIDPVQKSRNAAAAISEEKYNKFIQTCKSYLKKPSNSFFVPKVFNLSEIKKKYNLVLEITPEKGKLDVVGAALKKRFDFLAYTLEKNDFKILNKGWHWENKAYFYFKLASLTLPKEKEVIGPPLTIKPGVENFKKVHKKCYVKSGKLCTKISRKYPSALSLAKSILR